MSRVSLDPRTITVRNSRKRAIGGFLICVVTIILAPYLILGYFMGLRNEPAGFIVYVILLFNCFALWIWLPSLKRSLSAQGYLLLSDADGLSLFGAGTGFLKVERLPYADIKSVTGKKSFFADAVEIEKVDGTVIKVPVIFSDFRTFLRRQQAGPRIKSGATG